MVRVALIVNNPSRDLAGQTLLARELASRGAQVFLVPMALMRRELGALRPHFVLFNQLRPLNENIARDVKTAGALVGVLDDEGGVFSSFDWYGRQLSTDDDLRQCVDLFCAWGPRLAKYSASAGWYAPDAIKVTGHPRFDFYAPQFRQIKLPDAPDARKFPRPLVLINTRFSRANPAYGTPEEEIETLIKSRGFSREEARSFQDTMMGALRGIVELTNHLTDKFPKVTFVFRPHPFEKLETYEKLLSKSPNLHLNRTGEIGSWLAISDAVIHRSCTTAIEAGIRDVPALSPSWITMPDTIESTEVVSLPCENLNEVENAIAALEEKNLKRPDTIVRAHKQVVSDWFGFSDGLNHRRVADAILERMGASTPALDKVRFNQIQDGVSGDKSFLSSLRGKSKARKRDAERETKWRNSPKHFDAPNVSAIHQALARVELSTPSLTIAPAANSVSLSKAE